MNETNNLSCIGTALESAGVINMKSALFFVICVFSGCSNLPTAIKQAPVPEVDIREVQKNIDAYHGSVVRWGGTVIQVDIQQDSSWVQVLYYPLKGYGRPSLTQSALGRFIIRSKEFLDPAVYSKGTQITVAGTLNGGADRMIGEKTIKLPVVDLNQAYLWPKYNPTNYYAYPRYYPYPGYYYGFYGRPFVYGRGFLGCY